MRTIHLGALAVDALALFTFVGGAAAQTTSSAVLNSLEVQDLIKRAEPADHARLGEAAVHCDRLVTLSRDSAKEATEAAAMHKQLAGVAR